MDVVLVSPYNYEEAKQVVKENNYVEKIEEKANLQKPQAKKYLEEINVITNKYIDETFSNV